jgi:hypothetical protein
MSTVFRVQLRCDDCGHRYRRTVTDLAEPDPPCPKCATAAKAPIGMDVAAGRAPAVGGNPTVKAMDFTMEAVALDYGFTDLQTDGREGATMAPKLPPAQQAQADAMFNPAERARQMQSANPAVASRLNQIAATAMHGGYAQTAAGAPDPVSVAHEGKRPGERINARFVAGDGVSA